MVRARGAVWMSSRVRVRVRARVALAACDAVARQFDRPHGSVCVCACGGGGKGGRAVYTFCEARREEERGGGADEDKETHEAAARVVRNVRFVVMSELTKSSKDRSVHVFGLVGGCVWVLYNVRVVVGARVHGHVCGRHVRHGALERVRPAPSLGFTALGACFPPLFLVRGSSSVPPARAVRSGGAPSDYILPRRPSVSTHHPNLAGSNGCQRGQAACALCRVRRACADSGVSQVHLALPGVRPRPCPCSCPCVCACRGACGAGAHS